MKTRIRRLWTVAKSSWSVWLLVAFVIGLWGAWGQGSSDVERTPCPSPSPIVFCATEDSCRPEWNGQRWIIVREVP